MLLYKMLHMLYTDNQCMIYSHAIPFNEIYCIGLYQLCVIFTIVFMGHMTPINRPLALLISFYSSYEGAGKTIGVHEQTLAI